jgi:hypothetical protein
VGSIHFTPSGVSTGSRSGRLTAIASPSLLMDGVSIWLERRTHIDTEIPVALGPSTEREGERGYLEEKK